MGLLQRMTQFKDKSQDQEKNINMGLFDYPVLQAADILMYKADAVPAGLDQAQHIELTRKIARFFNNKFGKTFPEPKDIITETPKIMSLTDPTKKMSKSHGSKSYIGINDKSEVIQKKIRKAVSVSDMKDVPSFSILQVEQPIQVFNKLNKLTLHDKPTIDISMDKKYANPENIKMIYAICNFGFLLKNFGTKENKKYFDEQFKSQNIKFSELKNALAEDIANYFAPFREKREELEKDPEEVKKILNDGAQKARIIARETMKEVKEKVGLVL